MMIDSIRVKIEIKVVAQELKEMKNIFTEPKQPKVTLALYRKREDLRRQATILCSIRAHQRGKLHQRGTTLAQQEELIQEQLKQYEVRAVAE